MAVQIAEHPVVQVFNEIRMIEEGVRDAIAESLPPGLTGPGYSVLLLLELRGDGATPAEIAQALHTPKSGVTAILQRLTAKSFVRVEPCAEDGRKKRVTMTDEGREAFAQAVAGIRPKMDRLREAFTMDEFREVLPFLKALHAWFAQRDWA